MDAWNRRRSSYRGCDFRGVRSKRKTAHDLPFYCVSQVPIHYNEYSTGRPHVPGHDKDRFRSKYLDIPNTPLYPFGYGLEYTSFEVSGVTLDADRMTKKDTIHASVTIRNTGKREGTETLQLYIHDVAASVVRRR